MKKQLVALIALAAFGLSPVAMADIVYVTARPSPCTVTTNCPGPNMDGTYHENFVGFTLGDYGAAGTALGHPPTTVSRCYVGGTPITDPDFGVDLTPTLGVPGGIYQIDYNFNSLADNTTEDVVFNVTCTDGGTLSFTETDVFQRSFGKPATRWNTMGFLTNNPGSATPTIQFRYKSGQINAGTGNRILFDCWRFTLVEPCLAVPVVEVTGPLGADSDQVVVTKVSADATALTVYQDTGAGMTMIGTKTEGVTEGVNSVTVTGLVKGAKVAATQTIDGQEGCTPPDGIGVIVGGGANPRIRIAFSLQENPTATGPVGANGTNGRTSMIHFAPATSLYGGAPGDGALIIYPSNDWQTVTIDLGRQGIGEAANVAGEPGPAPDYSGYSPGNTVAVQVYAYKEFGGNRVYSPVGAASPVVTSNEMFTVTWTWDAVEGADGYRLLRNWNDSGFTGSVDVTGATTLLDTAYYPTDWQEGEITVTPTTMQTTPTMAWNPSVSNSVVAGEWAIWESIALANDDPTDCGPYDIYIDDLANGANGIFEDFESLEVGTPAGAVFNQPSFSGQSTVLPAPNSATITDVAAATGSKSIRVRWQYPGNGTNLWVRLNMYNTSARPNPLVNLNEPLSFRLLLLPVGVKPVPPLGPVTISGLDGTSLNYTGGGGKEFILVKSADINAAMDTWTPVATNNATPGSFTIPLGSETRAFYRVQSR